MADEITRRAALMVLRSGELTMAQVAARAGVSRATVLKWCRAAGIDAARAQERRADKRFAYALTRMESRRDKALRPRSAAAIKAQMMDAYREWQTGARVNGEDELEPSEGE